MTLQRLLLSAAAGALLLGGGHAAVAALPDFVLTFEESDGSFMAGDSLENLEVLPLTKASHISREDARFGKGSLLIRKGEKNATGGWYASLAGRPELAAGTGRFSMTGWLRLQENDGGISLIRRSNLGGGANGVLAFGIDRLQRLYCTIDAATVRSAAVEIPIDQWFHIAMTYDAGKICFYYNGTLMGEYSVAQEELPALLGQGSFSCLLHARENTRADDVAMMGGRVLTAEEIEAVSQEGWQAHLEKTK